LLIPEQALRYILEMYYAEPTYRPPSEAYSLLTEASQGAALRRPGYKSSQKSDFGSNQEFGPKDFFEMTCINVGCKTGFGLPDI